MKKGWLALPIILIISLVGLYYSGVFSPNIGAQPEAEDIIKDINLEWGSVTEDEIEIEATIVFYNDRPAVKILIRNLKMEIESRGINLGEITSEDEIDISPHSEKTIDLVLSTETDNFLDWFIKHVNDNEISTGKVKIYLFITWKGVELELQAWAKEIPIETNILGELEGKVMERLSGQDC